MRAWRLLPAPVKRQTAKGAQAIVSGDKDLLVLQRFEGIAIITAAQALQQLEVGG